MGASASSTSSTELAAQELLRIVACQCMKSGTGVDAMALKIRDWDGLLDLAEEHRLLPLLHARLSDTSAAIPEVTRKRLRAAYEHNAFYNLANAVELISLLRAFDQEKIEAMPFKGVVLGASVYRDLTTRPAGDLDLLIAYENLPRAIAILLERGYEFYPEDRARPSDTMSASPSHCGEYHLERRSDGMIVELRWGLELAQRHFRRSLGIDWVWSRRRTAMLAGAEVPDMSPEITLLVLCMHGCKHVWSRLIWTCDVARLANLKPDLDWHEAIREAQRTGLWRTLALGVLVAHRVAGATVPEAVLRSFKSDATVRKLAKHVEENLFDSPGSRPMGRLPFSFQLLGFRDRVRFLFSPEFLEPNERDQAAMPLPSYLHPLYYLLRPFRILRDQSPR